LLCTKLITQAGQLQKIGIITSSKSTQATPGSAKRRSGQLDFSNLGPLKTSGTVGFSTFRDQDTEATRRRKARKKSNGNVGGALNDDSDDDDDESELIGKMQDIDEKEVDNKLAPEDVKFQGELADGVNRIHLKRAHSAEPDRTGKAGAAQSGMFPGSLTNPVPTAGNHQVDVSAAQSNSHNTTVETMIGSPLKKHRPSITAGDSHAQVDPDNSNLGLDDMVNRSTATQSSAAGTSTTNAEEEEL